MDQDLHEFESDSSDEWADLKALVESKLKYHPLAQGLNAIYTESNENDANKEHQSLQCEVCDETFDLRESLNIHMAKFHAAKLAKEAGLGKGTCSVCESNPNDTMLIRCGHCICSSCFSQLVQPPDKLCPVCGKASIGLSGQMSG